MRRFPRCWADGIHFRIRLEDDRLCTLVLICVHEDGYRESNDSWIRALRDLATRSVEAPCLAMGDGALGTVGGVA